MRKLILLTLLVVAGAVYAANYAKYTGTQIHSATTSSGAAGFRCSTDVWLGPTEQFTTAMVNVGFGRGYIPGVGAPRGIGLKDSGLIRLITRSAFRPTTILRSTTWAHLDALTIPRVMVFDTIANDTTFYGEIGVRIVTSDTTSDSTVTGIKYNINYEVILK